MMRINEMGKFVLIFENSKQYSLNYETNLVCVKGKQLFIGNEAVIQRYDADVIFMICFTEKSIVLIKAKGKVYVENCEVDSNGCELADDNIISTDKAKMQFRFICNESTLEKLLDIYMDGNLYYTINMDYYFYQYAKKLKITDKKAISNVMATIDIPEIDKL